MSCVDIIDSISIFKAFWGDKKDIICEEVNLEVGDVENNKFNILKSKLFKKFKNEFQLFKENTKTNFLDEVSRKKQREEEDNERDDKLVEIKATEQLSLN